MSRSLAVIIPALNEEERIATAVASARTANADRVVVVDGGSRDATRAAAVNSGAEVLSSAPPRAVQLNTGASFATDCAIFCFLHADSILPPGAGNAIRDAVDGGADAGGFRIAFTERSARLRFAETMINVRTALTRQPWGDQAQFFTRETFEAMHGYPEMPLMEDYEMIRRARRRFRTVLLPLYTQTSGRRFLERGLMRTSWTNWSIIVRYHFGASADELARDYRRRP